MAPPVELLIIDAQNDFCDLPPAFCPVDARSGQRLTPALPVPGAPADLERLTGFIHAAHQQIAGITGASHHCHDIAHPPYRRTGAGDPVAPFVGFEAQAAAFADRIRALGVRTLGQAQARAALRRQVA